MISFFIILVISSFSLISGQAPNVLDTDQMPLVSGISYYIMPFTSGRGGGVKLAPTTYNQTCPLDVAQENNPELNGMPLNFIPINRGGGVIIRESMDVDIMFSGGITTCGKPAVWRIETVNGQQVVTSRGTLSNPVSRTIRSWFEIWKYEAVGYKIMFCLSVCNSCRPACRGVGSVIAKTGRRSLLLSDEPLKLKFIKA